MKNQNNQNISEPEHILLICTVGGNPKPLITSVTNWKPNKICFVVSKESKELVESEIIPASREKNKELVLHPANFCYLQISNEQDIKSSVLELSSLHPQVQEWNSRDSCKTVVDITGGTKCMSAALGLVARSWDCRFSYIGGAVRDKNGRGIVQDGTEQVYQTINPLESLGRKYIEDGVLLFNSAQFSSASSLLDHARKLPNLESHIKSQFSALIFLADAYKYWDSFQHGKAIKSFNSLLSNINDFNAALPNSSISQKIQPHIKLCKKLADEIKENQPGELLIKDLLANAMRRANSGQYDDSIARLYRACEAIAQLSLCEYPGFSNTGKIEFNDLPQKLQKQWRGREKNGIIEIGLKNSYTLLQELGANKGKIFFDSVLSTRTSPLTARNQSILAHGFSPCSEKTYNALRQPVYELAGNPDLSEFEFPKI